MKNYLHLFDNNSDFSDVYNDDSKYYEPFVSDTIDFNTVNYNKYRSAFIFKILSNGYIEFKATDNTVIKEIQYKLNDGEWTTISSSTVGTRIQVSAGDSLEMKGTNESYANSITSYNTFSGSTAQFNLSGSILFLLSKDKQIYGEYAFANMFLNCTNLKSIENLKIAVEKAPKYTFFRTFKGCTNINELPQIFTILYGDEYALKEMFMGCTSLQDNIETAYICENLEANTCESMFENCTSLMYFPKLMTTNLHNACYKRMFYGCSNLLKAGFYFDTLGENSCESMFENCTSLLEVEKLNAITAKTECYKRMFAGCISLEKSPIIEINEITGATNIFREMFYGCTSLNEIFIENYSVETTNQFINWVANVANSGTFHKNANTTFLLGNNGIPTNWVIKDLNFRELPFTFKVNKGKGQLKFNFTESFGNDYNKMNISYTLNGSERIPIIGNETLNLITGDVISLYGNPSKTIKGYYYNSYNYIVYFTVDTSITELEVYGNTMSLSYADDFPERINTASLIDLESFFYNIKSLVYAHNLILPDKLGTFTLKYMFYQCSGLKTIPALPAVDLIAKCYYSMFGYCSSLISLPEHLLPATTLANQCYYSMFYNCYNLLEIPEHLLPATTLANQCYYNMFYNCNSLTAIPENLLPATTLASDCYYYMFRSCSRLTTLPENLLPATTLANQCYYGMFHSCTGLTTLPEHLLPATTLESSCYQYMFSNCNLESIPEHLLPATTLASYCYDNMFYGNNFVTLPEHLLPATTLASCCYQEMFHYCTNLFSLPKHFLPATTLASYCYRYMFETCYNLEYACELPASISANYCYNCMFLGCYRLRTISCLLTTITGANPVNSMVQPNEYGSGSPTYSTFVFIKKAEVPFESLSINNVWQNLVMVNKDNLYTSETTYKIPCEDIILRIKINADKSVNRIQMSQYDQSLHLSMTEFTVNQEYADLYRSFQLEIYASQIDNELTTSILFENFDENDVKLSEYRIYINRTTGKFFDFNTNNDWELVNLFTGNDTQSYQNLTLSGKGTRTAKIQFYGYTTLRITVKPGGTSSYYHLVVSKVNTEAKFPDATSSTTANTWTSYNKSSSTWYNITFSSLNPTQLNTIELKWGSDYNSTTDRCYAYISNLQ